METIKGFKDYTGEEARKRAEIKKILIDSFEKYGFEPAETPVIEYEDFVKGNNVQDEAVSDIFKLQDRGKRRLALRYELTFQLKRLMKNKKLPYKRFQIGPVFRDEPVSSNRFRQFIQCDVDIVGSNIKDDAEILAVTKEILDKLRIKAILNIGNRELLNEILDDQGIKENKEQILREIDKLNKLSEREVKNNLKKFDAEKLISILKNKEAYFKKFKSYKNIEELKKYCKFYGIKAVFQPSLVRGLSYYNKNVFEIKTKKFKESLIGGGSYMFNNVQCTGISFGLDRIATLSNIKLKNERALIISLNQDKEAIKLAQALRKNCKNVNLFYGKPSKALDYANSYGIEKVIFIGKEEIKMKKFRLKDMKTGKEILLNLNTIIKALK